MSASTAVSTFTALARSTNDNAESASPNSSARLGGTRPDATGRARVRSPISGSMSRSSTWLSADAPPHFWALALLIKENYANARVPMLPVVRGEQATARQIVVYSLVLVAATLLPWGWGGAGPLYVVCALALGGVFVWLAERLRRNTAPRQAMLLFHYSLLYLALLFAALALDVSL